MSLEIADVKGVGGWLAAAGLAILRVFTKVDEGRIYTTLERLEGKFDTIDGKVDALITDVAVLKDHDGRRGNGGDGPMTFGERIPVKGGTATR